MNAHPNALFFGSGNDLLQKIPKIFPEFFPIHVFIQSQQFSESFHRIFVTVNNISTDKALCLDYNRINQFGFFGFGDNAVQLIHFLHFFL